jgi:hypothetical protein
LFDGAEDRDAFFTSPPDLLVGALRFTRQTKDGVTTGQEFLVVAEPVVVRVGRTAYVQESDVPVVGQMRKEDGIASVQ